MKQNSHTKQDSPFLSALVVNTSHKADFENCLFSEALPVEKEIAVGNSHTAFLMQRNQNLSLLVNGLTNCKDFGTSIEVIPFLDVAEPRSYLEKLATSLEQNSQVSEQTIARFWNEDSPFGTALSEPAEVPTQLDQQLAFQAIVDQSREKTAFFETFTRWPNLSHKQGYQPNFSEDSDYHTLTRALALLESDSQLVLSVNFPRSRFQKAFLDRAISLISQAGLEVRQRLVIEVVEAWAVSDFQPIYHGVEKLIELGCQIAFDDVGAGILPFDDIMGLQPHYLKLDRLFVQHSISGPNRSVLLEGFVSLAEELGCKLVAEGVETAEQSARLLELGISLQQGYFVAKEHSFPSY